MNGIEDWLREHHGAMTSPSEVLSGAVRRATGQPPADHRRLIVGQVNEVYDVTLADGRQVVVRISHVEDPRFEAERWALDAARDRGVPTPRVLHLETGPERQACVEEMLPGVQLATLLGEGLPASVVEDLGALLGRIHEVSVDGFGYLQPDGRGWPIAFRDIMLDLLPEQDRLFAAAAHWQVPDRQVTRGLDLLAAHDAIYDWSDPRLVHGDFTPDNILVHDGRVSGILDLQECSGGHPIEDLMIWDHVVGRYLPLDRLLETYTERQVFDATYEPLFHLVLLRRTLHMLMVRLDQANPYDVAHLRAELARALDFFGR